MGTPGLRVLSRSSRPGSLFTWCSRPFCSSATSSRPLNAQRLAEKLRAQKQEQKTKKVPVSLERPLLPRGNALTAFPGVGCDRQVLCPCGHFLLLPGSGYVGETVTSIWSQRNHEQLYNIVIPRTNFHLNLTQDASSLSFIDPSLSLGAYKPCSAEGAGTSATHTAATASTPQCAC